jgi:hypothetical protein
LLFASDFSSALEKQRATLIEHCETKFEKKSNKATRVDTLEFTFKSKENKTRQSFNSD